jgi:hypothetical protein
MNRRTTFRICSFVNPVNTIYADQVGIKEADIIPNFPRDSVKVEEAWVEAPIGNVWVAAYRLLIQDGHPVIAELRIFPAEPVRDMAGRWSAEVLGHNAKAPHGGITARLLRCVRLGEHINELGKIIRWWRQKGGDELFEPDAMLGRRGFKAEGEQKSRRGRPQVKRDLFFAKFAADYEKLLRAGSRKPVAEIAKRRKLPKEKVRAVIHEARKRRLFSKGIQGKGGGTLTNKAQELLHRKKNRRSQRAQEQ